PFKVCPDFLDPGMHTLSADGGARSRVSRNLDTWLLPHATVVELFARAADGADIAVAEGMMGLYDGVDGRTDAGSTAEVSKLLQVPVVLVLDAAGAVRSAAAAAMGFAGFDPDVIIAGVIADRVGGTRDEAFSFYYQDGLDLLESRGARLVSFSPMHDRILPAVDGLYLGGGFPEVHAAALSENAQMRAAIKDAAVSGVPMYAECGGMIYLARQLVDGAGREYDMAGVLPVVTSMQPRLAALGHVTL